MSRSAPGREPGPRGDEVPDRFTDSLAWAIRLAEDVDVAGIEELERAADVLRNHEPATYREKVHRDERLVRVQRRLEEWEREPGGR